MNHRTAAEIARGRLNLPPAAKLRIQKNVSNALQVFSERMAMDENKRNITLTPKTVTGTPTLGILPLDPLVTSNNIMIDRLSEGRIYNDPAREFTSANVSVANNLITLPNTDIPNETRGIYFATTGVLPSPLFAGSEYLIIYENETTGAMQIWQPQIREIPSVRITLTSGGMGTHTIIVDGEPQPQPMSRKANPNFASFPVAFMPDDKFWWLIDTKLYAFTSNGSAITTPLQFNVPRSLVMSDFDEPAVSQLADEFIDVLVELTAQAEAKRANTA